MGTRGRTGRIAGGTGRARTPGATAVQLLPHLLAGGELGRPRVGDRLDVVPAIYAGVIHADTSRRGVRPSDQWWVDEFGCVAARGDLTTIALDPHGGCSCRIEVLDAGGRLAPVNWAATQPPEGDGPVYLEGSLYLDPVLDAGTAHGEAVALCRRSVRLAAVHRYRRTPGVPVRPVPLDRFPAPAEVSDDAVYIADLVDDPSFAVPTCARDEAEA
ncbi:hypothetical protein [Actinomycetospora sp. NBRC 106378]|uniref:hypothetical protein n=1 Tax=Actinomycetospora sp. NBRC 106378 TaxID=3032208 RepID=UPI0024A20CA2|nr:hypothetical protein [Actinomycetospora sp. NBRC 106378]GLZ50884.1 hypothetical protein Acsp07_05010 [Actinomycetospora sp. NBRC 106378]